MKHGMHNVCRRDCPDRRGGENDCHLTCERYIKAKAAYEKQKAEIRRQRDLSAKIALVQYGSLGRRTKRGKK